MDGALAGRGQSAALLRVSRIGAESAAEGAGGSDGVTRARVEDDPGEQASATTASSAALYMMPDGTLDRCVVFRDLKVGIRYVSHRKRDAERHADLRGIQVLVLAKGRDGHVRREHVRRLEAGCLTRPLVGVLKGKMAGRFWVSALVLSLIGCSKSPSSEQQAKPEGSLPAKSASAPTGSTTAPQAPATLASAAPSAAAAPRFTYPIEFCGKKHGEDTTRVYCETSEVVDGIKDLGPLAGLKKLRVLTIIPGPAGTPADDLSPLRELTELREVVLADMRVKSIEPLAGLTKLETLSLGNSGVRDLTPLAKLTRLRKLDLSWAREVSDLTPLSGMTELREFRGVPVSDLSQLEPLQKLEILVVGSSKVTDLTPLQKLPALRELNLNNCEKLADASPLSKLSKLTRLDLGRTKVTDLAPLASLSDLTYLRLANCKLADISPLANLGKLEFLDIGDTGLMDVSPVFGLAKLKTVQLYGTRVPEPQRAELKTKLPGLTVR